MSDDWLVDAEGSQELHPPQGTYLVEVTGGSDTITVNGEEVKRTRKQDNCPQILYKFKVLMDVNGNTDWQGTNFNVSIPKNKEGMAIIRRMIRCMLGEKKGNVAINTDTFDNKRAWVELRWSGRFCNIEHSSWAPPDRYEITGSVSSSESSEESSEDGEGKWPF